MSLGTSGNNLIRGRTRLKHKSRMDRTCERLKTYQQIGLERKFGLVSTFYATKWQRNKIVYEYSTAWISVHLWTKYNLCFKYQSTNLCFRKTFNNWLSKTKVVNVEVKAAKLVQGNSACFQRCTYCKCIHQDAALAVRPSLK